MMCFLITSIIVFSVYIITKKFHFKKPLAFTLLMGTVFIFILWGIV